jgi:excisionase family DNA binding protein
MKNPVDNEAITCERMHVMATTLNPGVGGCSLEAMSEAWMTVSEACELLRVSRSRIYTLINTGRIRAEKAGILKVNTADVEAYADSHRKPGWPKGKPRSEGDDE